MYTIDCSGGSGDDGDGGGGGGGVVALQNASCDAALAKPPAEMTPTSWSAPSDVRFTW